MAKKMKYHVGDVFEIKLDDEGNIGYARFKGLYDPINLDKDQTPLVEAFKVSPRTQITDVNELNCQEILFHYRINYSLLNGCNWQLIGNLPIEEDFVLPDEYTTDMFTGQYILFKDGKKVEVEKEQVKDAVFCGNLPPEGFRLQIIRKLKEVGLYEGDK